MGTTAWAIPTNPFDSGLASHRPLLIGSAGGGGHIAGVEGWRKNHQLDAAYLCEEWVLHTAKPHTPNQLDTTSQWMALGAKTINRDFHGYGHTIRKGIASIPFIPLLPDADAIEQEAQALSQKNTHPRYYVDNMLDVIPEGYYGAAVWNILQRAENKVAELKKLINFQGSTDERNKRFVTDFYFNLLRQAALDDKPYTELISTQAMALPAISQAILQYNEWLNQHNHPYPKVELHQYMTDLPTPGAIHFFNSLKRLTREEAQVMKLYAVTLSEAILTHHLGSHKDFFKDRVYNIDPLTNPLIRPGFKDPTNHNHSKFDQDIEVQIDVLNTAVSEWSKQTIQIPASQKIASIMLGSQATQASIDYALQLAKAGYRVFVFGGNKLDDPQGLLNHELIIKLDNQDPPAMTQLMTRSDVIITRSGGLSVMEQMAMPHNADKQQIFIHHAKMEQGVLTSGIDWENDNASGLCQHLSGKVQAIHKIQPQHLSKLLKLKAQGLRLRDELKDIEPSFLAYLTAAYEQNDDDGAPTVDLPTFDSCEQWYDLVQSCYVPANNGMATTLKKAIFYQGLQQFQLMDLSKTLEHHKAHDARNDFLYYQLGDETHPVRASLKELRHLYQSQIQLYKVQNPSTDPNKTICRGIQHLIMRNSWQHGLLGGMFSSQKVRLNITRDEMSYAEDNKIPKSMMPLLDIIDSAAQGQINWHQAVTAIYNHIEKKHLDKSRWQEFDTTTCAFAFFKQCTAVDDFTTQITTQIQCQ